MYIYVYYVNGPNITNHISHVAPYRKKITNITNFMLEKQNQCTCHTLRRLWIIATKKTVEERVSQHSLTSARPSSRWVSSTILEMVRVGLNGLVVQRHSLLATNQTILMNTPTIQLVAGGRLVIDFFWNTFSI